MLDEEVWTCAQDRVPPLLGDEIVSLYVLVKYNDFDTEQDIIDASIDSSCSRPFDCLDKILLTFYFVWEKYRIVKVWSNNSETKGTMKDAKHEA